MGEGGGTYHFQNVAYDHFHKYTILTSPIHMLHAGHSSHFNSAAVRHAKESDVILFILVPHATYEIQLPNNIGPLKSNWRNPYYVIIHANPRMVIIEQGTIQQFALKEKP